MKPTSSIFDYVKYDSESAAKQLRLKEAAQRVETAIRALETAVNDMDASIDAELANKRGYLCPNGELARGNLHDIFGDRGSDDLIVCLEQSYMWCGKALRDQQIERGGSAELQEERTNS